jgi:natural product biosynthesis luciferase-like monooxygenase protein
MYDLDEDRGLPLLLGAEGVRVQAGDLQLEPLTLEHRGAMLDLSLIAANIDGDLRLFLQFNQDLFDRQGIEQLADRFDQLLDDIGRDSTQVAARSQPTRTAAPAHDGAGVPGGQRDLDFSLFFFAAEGERSSDGTYRLLFEAARFADAHGFAAVWTPERHFHPFGGIYPNPSVTGAAVAAITSRIQIRAGSVVLPLHHPLRVAEEWSVVDNVSNGRVAVSFASGWHANDFVLAPDHFDRRREVMAREIEVVRRLWRGESVAFVAGDGREVEVRIWPTPIQKELPIWVTAFGSPETFRLAGEIGAGVLTHLLGQSVADLGSKIALYREARQRRGLDPDRGQVAVMLHTFIGDSVDQVRRTVRDPFIDYLKTSVELARVGEQAGLAANGEHYRQTNIDTFLQATCDRYFASQTLFGTPETCAALVDRLRAIGVTEIACLIDFGVEVDRVLASLPLLERLRSKFTAASPDAPVDRDAAHLAITRSSERVQWRKQAMERQARIRVSTGSDAGHARKDDRA